MQEMRVRSLGWEDPLEKEMAPYSSILASRIPWTEEAGGLQSILSQRVGRDWNDLAQHSTRDSGSIPGSGRSPGVGNSNPLQYCCLENSTDRGTWQAIVHGVTKSWVWLNMYTHTHPSYSNIGLAKRSVQVFHTITEKSERNIWPT